MAIELSIPPLLGLAESAGDAEVNLRDVLLAHHGAIEALEASAASAVVIHSTDADTVTEGTEQWLREWTVSLGNLSPSLICIFLAQVEGEGIFRIRIGGTRGQVDGLLVAELATNGEEFREVNGLEFSNVSNITRVKLTGLTIGQEARIFSPTITLR